MHNIPANVVTVVAADTRAILHATDEALLANAQMLASVIQGVRASDLPINITQELYSRIVAHGGKIVEGREDLKDIISTLTWVKKNSTQREMDSGCPLGFPEFTEGGDGGDGDGFFTGATLKTGQTA